MKRVFLSALFAAAVAVAATWPSSVSVEAAPPATPTFNKDVLPVLQKQCQECHRPNSIAPMSFLTYKDTRPYARAIEKAVVGRTMPPWFADPTVGHFKNTKLLTDAEIETAQRLGEERRARRRSERQAGARAVRRRVDDRKARHHRAVPERDSAAGDRRHRPVEPRRAGRTSSATCG